MWMWVVLSHLHRSLFLEHFTQSNWTIRNDSSNSVKTINSMSSTIRFCTHLHESKCRVYNMVQTTCYTQEQEDKIGPGKNVHEQMKPKWTHRMMGREKHGGVKHLMFWSTLHHLSNMMKAILWHGQVQYGWFEPCFLMMWLLSELAG